MTDTSTSSLYIHIPFCRRKCLYCDFFSGGASIADWEAYASALTAELRLRAAELTRPVESVYFGGGTPSLIPPHIFTYIIKEIRERLTFSDAGCETTIEVNPDDVTAPDGMDKIRQWKRGGVNRVSIGVQSFDDPLLRLIGRSHSGDTARQALDILTSEFRNVSADLIFGLPRQTLRSLASDLDTLHSFAPQHVSVYSLMFEEGTALTALRDAGRIREADDELTADMYALLTDRLKDWGYEHYEISNYALPGYRSRHNSGYWTGRQYLGLGPSAHSYDGESLRRANPADIRGYIRHFSPMGDDANRQGGGIESCAPAFFTEENLTPDERIEESVMLSLRRKEGIDLTDFTLRFGDEAARTLLARARKGVEAGDLHLEYGHLSLTPAGIMISDRVILSLI